MEMEKLLDLCNEQFARSGDDLKLRALCDEAERMLNEEDDLEVLGDLFASSVLGD